VAGDAGLGRIGRMRLFARSRWWLAAALLAAALALGFGLLQWAAHALRGQVVAALGPRATLASVALVWDGVELRGLRIAAAPRSGWPTADELRAERVHVAPDLRSLFGGPWRVRAVRVEGGYLSLQRTRGGRLRLLPALLEERPAASGPGAAAAGGGEGRSLLIGGVELVDAVVELHDASIGARPHRLRLERLDARAGPLALPALDRPVDVALDGVLQGVRRHGRVQVQGSLTPATRDAQIAVRLAGVDLVALQPYLLKAADTGVRGGTLDLALDATVQKQRLHAPGRLTLSGLELANGRGPLAGLAGLSRQAVLSALQRDGKLRVAFTLEGRLDDPGFSLNENLATRVAAGLADSVGVSVGGMVQGVGGLVRGLFGR
jgi:hypothetical protein